ncbi:TPA: type IV toxin-antitoxin system YeeU family antitoxin, partial [Citrobacter freundii]|nr:type IV toxin-antitoxin system YeeU family antitoxin [Citrobacter freundii]
MSKITWGLQRDITPRLGARLVQEGNRLHYLADRASMTGKFSDIEYRKLDETFPH